MGCVRSTADVEDYTASPGLKSAWRGPALPKDRLGARCACLENSVDNSLYRISLSPLRHVGASLAGARFSRGNTMKALSFAPWMILCTTAALAAPPSGFEARVESLRQDIGVPGMAIAIVEDNKVTLAKGFGVKRLGAPDPVDADAIFPTGSTGKAFTVAALGILVDEGKIHWDDKVIDRLPGFQMYDPWVTREMTIRDLLVHRSGLGLGAGDLLFVPRTNLSRAESVRIG